MVGCMRVGRLYASWIIFLQYKQRVELVGRLYGVHVADAVFSCVPGKFVCNLIRLENRRTDDAALRLRDLGRLRNDR